MARVSYLTADQLREEDRELLARPINLFRALANRPEVLRPYAALGEWVRWQSALLPRRRELLILTIGLAARCRYEVAHHVRIAKEFGVSDDELDELFSWFGSGSPGDLAPPELVVCRAGRQLAETGVLGDELWAALVAEVGADDALDVVLIASYYAMVVRVLAALGVENEESYEPDAARFDALFDSEESAVRP